MNFNCSEVLLLAQCTLKLNWMASRMLQHCQIPKKHRRIEFMYELFVSGGGIERMTLDNIRVSRANDEINETIISNSSSSSSTIHIFFSTRVGFLGSICFRRVRGLFGGLPVKDMTCYIIWLHKQDEHPWSSWQ